MSGDGITKVTSFRMVQEPETDTDCLSVRHTNRNRLVFFILSTSCYGRYFDIFQCTCKWMILSSIHMLNAKTRFNVALFATKLADFATDQRDSATKTYVWGWKKTKTCEVAVIPTFLRQRQQTLHTFAVSNTIFFPFLSGIGVHESVWSKTG